MTPDDPTTNVTSPDHMSSVFRMYLDGKSDAITTERRDYFAASAIGAFVAAGMAKGDGYAEMAAACYELADALIAARGMK